jgi:hypothetical protein
VPAQEDHACCPAKDLGDRDAKVFRGRCLLLSLARLQPKSPQRLIWREEHFLQ